MASKAAKFSGRSSTSRILTLSLGPSGPSGLFQDCFSKDIDSSIQANSHLNTTSYCVGHLGNIAELRRQIAGQLNSRCPSVLPSSSNALYLGLTSQLTFGTDFARHSHNFQHEVLN